MQMKKSDVLDRWTILLMKARFSPEAKVELEAYTKECGFMVWTAAADEYKPWHSELLVPIMQLMEANAKCWENEASIRKELPNDPAAAGTPDLEEVGRRSLAIRGYNAQRVAAKRAIDEFYGEIADVKVDHASERTI